MATWLGLLLAGVVVSVLTAWGCALWLPVQPHPAVPFQTPTAGDVAKWQSLAPPGAMSEPAAVRQFVKTWGLRAFVATGDHSRTGTIGTGPTGVMYFTAPVTAQVDQVVHVVCGWPLPCVAGERWNVRTAMSTRVGLLGSPNGNWAASDVEQGCVSFVRPKYLGGPSLRLLPFRPVIHLFLLNVAFWAGVFRGGAFVWQRSRASYRRRRGLCPRCAYRCGASAICTECGVAVARRS